MNRRILEKLFLLILAFCIIGGANAQTTIGSTNKPMNGALLMLDDGTKGSNGQNAKKGMMLPRVEIQDLNNLKMSPTANDLAGSELEHTGLTVYHVMAIDDVCEHIISGVYVWEGSKWDRIGAPDPQPIAPTHTLPITNKVGLEQPNSYIVSQSSVVKIPVEKARIIWDGASWKGDTEFDVSTFYPVLPTARIFGALSAEVVWSSDQCGELILNANNLKIINEGGKEFIEVWVGDVKGNAVVALKDGEDIVWSWHIWATDAPDIKYFNSFSWLDRNLGATSAAEGDANSIGLLYQWGRKDPLPGSNDWTNNNAMPIYNSNNKSIEMDLIAIERYAPRHENLESSIHLPITLIANQLGTQYDWYHPLDRVMWHDRWGISGIKSPSDPCPEGWRVPNGSGANSYPWDHPISDWGTSLNNDNFKDVMVGGEFRGKSHVDAGYYPAAGGRANSNGILTSSGTYAVHWSSIGRRTSLVRSLAFGQGSIEETIPPPSGPGNGRGRSRGYPVRCVQE